MEISVHKSGTKVNKYDYTELLALSMEEYILTPYALYVFAFLVIRGFLYKHFCRRSLNIGRTLNVASSKNWKTN